MLRHLVVACLGVLAFAWSMHASAQASVAIDWGFESSASGWLTDYASLAIATPAHSGSGAGRLTSAAAGQRVQLTSDYQFQPAASGGVASATLWLSGSPVDFQSVRVFLELMSSGGTAVRVNQAEVTLAGSFAPSTVTVLVVPDSARYARVRVEAMPARVGAVLLVDSVQLVVPALTATATTTATATGTTTATGTATATATPTVTATATATATVATPTPSPTPVATPAVFPMLTNGDFEDTRPLYGWSAQGGVAGVGSVSGAPSRVATLVSSSTSTKWLHQAVTVIPDRWYSATAHLTTPSGGANAWLRLAWYASEDGSGSQLGVADSPVVPASGGTVALGPVQAPATAQSVRVRLMLRPSSSSLAILEADDVALASVPAPRPTPAVTATVVATSLPTVSPTVAPASSTVAGSPGAGVGTAVLSPGSATVLVQQVSAPAVVLALEENRERSSGSSLLRITELLPDPLEPGPDADYEWVEVANLGPAPQPLGGYTLTDNAGVVALPETTLGPGDVLVLQGGRVEVGAAAIVHTVAGGLSNGLGNAGDRVALASPSGAVVDAVSWGSDRTYALGRPELPAPGPGRSILRRFLDDGSLVSAEHSSTPTPGRIDDSMVHLDEAAPAHLSTTATMPDRGWPLLLAIAATSLVLAGADRLRRALRER